MGRIPCAVAVVVSLVGGVTAVASRRSDDTPPATLDAAAPQESDSPEPSPPPSLLPSTAPSTPSPTPGPPPTSAQIAVELRSAYARQGPVRLTTRTTSVEPIEYRHGVPPGEPTEQTHVTDEVVDRFPDGSYTSVTRYAHPGMDWRVTTTIRVDRARGLQLQDVDASDRQESNARQGLPYAAPDPFAPEVAPTLTMGAYARALLGAGEVTAREARWRGRPAWAVDVPVIYSMYGGVGGDEATVILDRQTGLVVDLVEREPGTGRTVLHYEVLSVEDSPAEPPKVAAGGESHHWRRGSFDDAARALEFRPPRPGRLPSGFDADGIAYIAQPKARLVQLRYRHGSAFALVTVRNRSDGPGGPAGDPFPYGGYGGGELDHPDADRFRPEPITLSDGDYAGRPAQVVIHPRIQQHIWFAAGEQIVTVSGDLTRDELVAAANSLRID